MNSKKDLKDLKKIKNLGWLGLDNKTIEWHTIGGISRATKLSQPRVSFLLLQNFGSFEFFEEAIRCGTLVRPTKEFLDKK